MKAKDLRYPPMPAYAGMTDALLRYSRLAAGVKEFASLLENSRPDTDDDTCHILIGLLTLEEYGPDFMRGEMAESYKKRSHGRRSFTGNNCR
jgi:hypothetical protein